MLVSNYGVKEPIAIDKVNLHRELDPTLLQ
jgi:hypothetical protein